MTDAEVNKEQQQQQEKKESKGTGAQSACGDEEKPDPMVKFFLCFGHVDAQYSDSTGHKLWTLLQLRPWASCNKTNVLIETVGSSWQRLLACQNLPHYFSFECSSTLRSAPWPSGIWLDQRRARTHTTFLETWCWQSSLRSTTVFSLGINLLTSSSVCQVQKMLSYICVTVNPSTHPILVPTLAPGLWLLCCGGSLSQQS